MTAKKTAAPTVTPAPASDRPAWVSRMLDLYQAGIAHAFILHFNTGDYAAPDVNLPVVDYLPRLLAAREIVATYSRDRGVTFATESMRQKALDLMGLGQPAPASDPALAALQAIGAAPAPAAGSEPELPRDPAAALPLLDRLLREGQQTAVIIDGVELITPAADLATLPPADRVALATIRRWGRDPALVAAGNPVYLVTNNLTAIHPELRAAGSRFESLEIPLPDQSARRRFIERYLADRGQGIDLGDLTAQTVANATAGLSLLHIEDILLRAEAAGRLTPGYIWDRKQDIIKGEFGEVLEIMQPRFRFDDIGGLGHVKEFFSRSVIRPIAQGRKQRVPMGVLLTGPAGTGKSICAEAVAAEAGVNAVKLRIGGQIASKWQGEGERNLEKALSAITGLAPTIVFIDEIDQAISRGDGAGGSQQDRRIFQRLLEFMAETAHRGEIVFLAATNRPDLMDAALRRPGRFDKKIPFLAPDESERAAIFEVMTRRYLAADLPAAVAGELASAADGWTGAEIEAAAVKAAELVEDESLQPAPALSAAVQRLSPSTADIELMTMLAVAETNDRDLLPPKYQKLLDDRAALDSKIERATGSEPARRQRREL